MKRRFLLLILLVLAFVAGAERSCVAAPPVVVLLRSKGVAFDQAAEGFKQKRKPALELLVDDYKEADLDATVRARHPEVVVAVGRAAAKLAEKLFPDLPQVLVAAPRTSDKHTAPVVSIDNTIPAEVELKRIAEILPDVQKIGILYDPASESGRLVSDLTDAADRLSTRRHPVAVVAIAVHSAEEIPAAFKKLAGQLQGRGALLFVPDPTVIPARPLLTELSTDARIPMIGFLSYPFINTGAVLAFEADYHKLGSQGAGAVAHLLAERTDEVLPPEFDTWVNPTSARQLGVRTDYDPDDVREYR